MVAIQHRGNIQSGNDKPVNYKALAWTIGVHALLLIVLYFIVFVIQPAPPAPVGEGGMEVNLGTSDNGSGTDQPMNTKAPAQYQATVVFKSTPVKSSAPKEMMRSTEADAPEVNDNNKKNSKAVVAVPKEPAHKQEKPKYSYPGENGEGGNRAAENRPGKNEGNGNGPGDKGVPSGTPGATNYSGTPGAGNGNGAIGHTLGGRDIFPKQFVAEFNESGKVVVHVTVDRSGNIINKYIKSSSSSQLNKIALEEINNVRFSKSDSPDPQQFGDVTIIFKTRH